MIKNPVSNEIERPRASNEREVYLVWITHVIKEPIHEHREHPRVDFLNDQNWSRVQLQQEHANAGQDERQKERYMQQREEDVTFIIPWYNFTDIASFGNILTCTI